MTQKLQDEFWSETFERKRLASFYNEFAVGIENARTSAEAINSIGPLADLICNSSMSFQSSVLVFPHVLEIAQQTPDEVNSVILECLCYWVYSAHWPNIDDASINYDRHEFCRELRKCLIEFLDKTETERQRTWVLTGLAMTYDHWELASAIHEYGHDNLM